MGLAGDDGLERARPGERRERPPRIGDEEVEPLVRGDAASEPGGEHVRVERARRALDVRDRLAAREPVGHGARADERDELRSELAADGPELLVGDARRRAAQRSGSAAHASRSAPRCRSSSARMGGAIHVGRWTPFVTCVIGTSSTARPGQWCAHMARATSPWRRLTAFADREVRSARSVMPNGCGVWAPGAHARASAPPGPRPSDARYGPSTLAMSAGAYASFPAATGVWVVNTTRARTSVERALERLATPERLARELERGEGGVTLVQVVERGPDAERGERAHAADAEERVLHEPVFAVADVELRGDEPVDGRVRGHVGVEQVQRDPANLRPPDARLDVSIADGNRHRERAARGVARRLEGELLGRDRRPVLVLQPRGIEPLVEVAATVHEAHGDERQCGDPRPP